MGGGQSAPGDPTGPVSAGHYKARYVPVCHISPLTPLSCLAGLFEQPSGPQEAAFLRAVNAVQEDRTILTKSRFEADVKRYPGDDSFKASKSLCELLRPGVAGMFGPVTSATSYHVQALANTLHVPFIMNNFDYIKARSDFSINVHPHPKILGKAYADFVRKTGWKSFIVLYETEEGLVKLQELLKFPKTFADTKITLRQLTPGTTDYRPLLKEIKKSEETRIVLDCDFDKIALILAQADEVGLLTDYHNYLGK